MAQEQPVFSCRIAKNEEDYEEVSAVKRNKLLSILLVLSLLLSMGLMGCSDDEDWEDEEEPTSAMEMQEEDKTEPAETKPQADETKPGGSGNEVPIIPSRQVTTDVEYDPENPQYGSGLDDGQGEGELDANPTRAIHRSNRPINFIPMTMTDGTPLGEEYFYYRSLLDENGQKGYDFIREELLKCNPEIEMILPVDKDFIFTLYCMVINDDPSLFYVKTGCNFTNNQNGIVTVLTPHYNQLVDSVEGYGQHIADATADALGAMWHLGNDLERVKYAHDYLTHNLDYVHGELDQCIYSSFVQHQTVCAGYSRALQYLLLKNGIRCAYISGDAGGPHAWNIVELDGETYAMDVTWDDPIGAGPNDYSYRFFNVTDGVLAENRHQRGNVSQALPAADATRLSYDNAFGGDAYGTDFGACAGQLPPQKETQDPSGDNGGSWWDDDPSGGDNGGSGQQSGDGWWNMLDESWTKDDWSQNEDGIWYIEDESTYSTYFYNESTDEFAVSDMSTGEFFVLNMETGEWEYME